MLIDKEELLFQDRFAPITSSMGFFEGDLQFIAQGYKNARIEGAKQSPLREKIRERSVKGNLQKCLESLLPLKQLMTTKSVFVPTRSRWTAYFTNFRTGADPAYISYLPVLLKTRSIWVVAEPHDVPVKGRPATRQGCLIFELSGHEEKDWSNLIRKIWLYSDMGKWHFELLGTPLPFENMERYDEKKKTDRFDLSLLNLYLREFGIDAFNEDFYLPSPNQKAILIEEIDRHGIKNEDLTLDKARRRCGII
jgi:hypothetical protein